MGRLAENIVLSYHFCEPAFWAFRLSVFSRPGVSMSSNGFRWLETLAVANLSPMGDVRYHRVGATYPEKLILFPWLSRPKSYHPLKFSLLLKEALPTAGANATAQAPQGKKVILFSRTTIRWSEGRISCAAPLYMAGMMKFFRNGPTARMHRVRWYLRRHLIQLLPDHRSFRKIP